MSEIRRVGPPRELAQVSEDLYRFEVLLSAAPSDGWLRVFRATAELPGCEDRELSHVERDRLVFECAEEDVFAWTRCLDARIQHTNEKHRECLRERQPPRAA
ncbi:MAG: hypothetical protein ACE147_16845 [Candidatus Methylomirabilales bacterium]